MMHSIDIERLTRPELLFLLKRFAAIDQRDIVNARWEMAEDAARRLNEALIAAHQAEIAAMNAELAAPPAKRRRLSVARAEAESLVDAAWAIGSAPSLLPDADAVRLTIEEVR